jgi:FkbM family methyltransferase
MKYGIVFLRSSRFRIKQIKIARNKVALSIPAGEEDIMDYEFKNILYDDCYGLRKIDGPVNTILDIGGNLGFFSMAARNQFPDARIHSYEPNPKIQDHLLNNTKQLSIEVHPEAVGASDGWIDLKTDTGSLFATAVASETGKIKKTAMAQAIQRLGGSVDLLKLDCEGAEWELFEQPEIWPHVKRLTMEYHLWANPKMDVPEMVRKLGGFGFRITHLCEEPKWGILHAIKI